MLKVMCKGWYNWIEVNEDYEEDLWEYYEGGCFRREGSAGSGFGRERRPAEWSSNDWIDEYLSDRSLRTNIDIEEKTNLWMCDMGFEAKIFGWTRIQARSCDQRDKLQFSVYIIQKNSFLMTL
jgi:hypothetical protein